MRLKGILAVIAFWVVLAGAIYLIMFATDILFWGMLTVMVAFLSFLVYDSVEDPS